jgi:nitrogenase molybdenum-cofactor synthesis protein NifE
MLLVAPGCCGRNTSLVSSLPAYHDRFFYLNMDETDVVTGRHLKKIPQAVEEVVNSLKQKPSVVMICITCVDALLGTDMERVCRKAEERVGMPVRPCYMYALTREGRKPPMVHVRQSLYSLLEPRKKKGNVVNLLGFFAPLADDCELYDYLKSIGVRTIHEISREPDLKSFYTMAEANFNLVLHSEARVAASDLEERLKIPSIELTRLYQIDKIQSQYRALGQVLGVTFEDDADYQNEVAAAAKEY